jgi:hypothetical protein
MKRGRISEKMFQFRISEKEMEEFNRAFEKTPYRTKSEYSRKMLLGKPVTIFYRNKSLDELIEWVVRLKRDLKSLSTRDTITAGEKDRLLLNVQQTIDQIIKIIEGCSQK